MCGIAGICRIDGQPLPEEARPAVKAMTDLMAHRGPDGEGQWQNGPVCLGHRRLSIIDLAGGSQPMASSDGNCEIVFNGEIYNFRELRAELEQKGMAFRTRSDTEVILAAWEAYGLDCLKRLEGMFAFALWDKRRRALFCARDHFGKKPFYYTAQNGFFSFASQLDALYALKKRPELGGMDLAIDPEALMRYLAYEYAPAPQTLHAAIKALEPAHYLLLEKGELKIGRYWDLPVPEAKAPGDMQELCQELERLMTSAVARRLVSDVPLGVFLSGGIDSTIVCGLMARLSTRPVQSFSIGFRESSYDESHYARIAANAYKTEHHEKVLEASQCADELPGIVKSMDTPMADASCAPTWLLSGLARERVTVALGGDGADEFWAGYEHYIGYRIAQWYNKIPKFGRKKIIEPLCRLLPASAGYINPRLAVSTFLKGAAAPDWLRVQTMLTALGGSMQERLLSSQWLEATPMGAAFLEDGNLFAPTRRQYEHWQGDVASLARAFYVYIRQFMLDDILVKVDRCSMLHSLEVRAPFLDVHVAEFAARLPLNYKLRGFRRKYLLKKAFAGLLPPQILRRNKRGFQIPVAEWLCGRLKPLLLDLLSEEQLRKQGIFNPKAVEKLMTDHFSGKGDYRKPLWTLLVLQLWLAAHPGE